MSMDKKLLMEIQSIGLCREQMVGALFSNTLVGSGHGNPNKIQLTSIRVVKDPNAPGVPNVEDDEPPLDFPHLEIPEMDVFRDAFGEQSLDPDSWLNIDDTILDDDDFISLEIPMDDLTDIKMIF
nr:hypothetical protein [Tanacetum cinerariifolium]